MHAKQEESFKRNSQRRWVLSVLGMKKRRSNNLYTHSWLVTLLLFRRETEDLEWGAHLTCQWIYKQGFNFCFLALFQKGKGNPSHQKHHLSQSSSPPLFFRPPTTSPRDGSLHWTRTASLPRLPPAPGLLQPFPPSSPASLTSWRLCETVFKMRSS